MNYEGIYEKFADCMFNDYTEIDMNKIRWNLRYYLWRILG